MSNIDSSEIKDLSSIVTQLPQIMTRYLMIQNGFADNYIVLNQTAYRFKSIIPVFYEVLSGDIVLIIACMVYMITCIFCNKTFSTGLVWVFTGAVLIVFLLKSNFKIRLLTKIKGVSIKEESMKPFLIWFGVEGFLTFIIVYILSVYFEFADIIITNIIDIYNKPNKDSIILESDSLAIAYLLLIGFAIVFVLLLAIISNAIMNKVIQNQIVKPLEYYKKYQPTASLHKDDNTVIDIDTNMILWIDSNNKINILDKKNNTYILESYPLQGNSKLTVIGLETGIKLDITESTKTQFFNTFP